MHAYKEKLRQTVDHNLKKISRLLYSIWMTAAVYFRPVWNLVLP